MANPGIYKNYKVNGVLSPYRIVALEDKAVSQAASAADMLIGTTDELGKQSNGGADIALSGLPEVTCGAPVAPGAPLTSDGDGCAVEAGAGDRIIGFALEDGVSGAIITYIHSLGYAPAAAEENA